METTFKGWRIPGPRRPVLDPPESSAEEETLDGLCGHLRIFQLKKGHRYSTDDLLVSWIGLQTCPRPERILDLGSGVGTIAHLAAWKCPGAKVTSIEAQEISHQLCKKTVALNGMNSQIECVHADFREYFRERSERTYDLIFGSPPYFPMGSGVLGNHPQKISCRFEMKGNVANYCETAAKVIAPGGVFALVFPVDPPFQRARMEEAAEQHGWQIVRQRDVIFGENQTPLIGLYVLMLREDLPTKMHGKTYTEAPLYIRRGLGPVSQITDEYRLIKLSLGMPPTDH